MGRRKTNEQFQKQFAAVGSPIELLSPYIDSKTKIKCRCKQCGYEWEAIPPSLLRGSGCNKCADKVRSAKRTKTQSQFIFELGQRNPSVEVIGKYRGIKERISVRCRACGHEWDPIADNLMQGNACPECGGTRQKTSEEFAELVNELHPNISLLEPYTRMHGRIKCRCGKCGYEWSPQASSLASGRGCPSCAGNAKKTNEEFLADLEKANPDVIPLEPYIHSTAPILVQCAKCGHTWTATPNNLLRLHRCPSCMKAGTSFLEQCLLAALRMRLGDDAVVSRDHRAIGKELDIYIPSMHLAVEPGSWAWHFNKLSRDNAKREACRAAGIRAITIYDYYPADEPAPFDSDCWTYEIDLGSEEGHATLRSLINRLFEEVEIDLALSDSDWATIEKTATRKSRRRDTERFKTELAEVNPNIEVLGEYRKVHVKIEVRCLKCHGEWSAEPNSLLRGEGCPYCAGKRALPGLNDLATKRPDILEFWDSEANNMLDPSTIGVGSHKRVWWKCPDCGSTWTGVIRDMCRKKNPCSMCKGR